ncbi:MAG: hypothetical protein LBC42_00865 [Puniceicoccales bacterium]|nr:hypothetical protein [Puniceicoccales bacterium]
MAQNSVEQYVNDIPEEFADIKSEWMQLLMQLGYVACGQGKPSLAMTIFGGIAAVRPNSELPLIGYAFALINSGRLRDACAILAEKASKINPNNQLIKAVAAMAFRMAGQTSASDMLIKEVIDDGTDPEAIAFAENLKNENFKFLKSKGR